MVEKGEPSEPVRTEVVKLAEKYGTTPDDIYSTMIRNYESSMRDVKGGDSKVEALKALARGNNGISELVAYKLARDLLKEEDPMLQYVKYSKGGDDFDMNKIFMFSMLKQTLAPPEPKSIPTEMLLVLAGKKGDGGDGEVVKLMAGQAERMEIQWNRSMEQHNGFMNTLLTGLLGKSQMEMQELIKNQGTEHKTDLERVRTEFIARMGAGGDPNSMDNIAMSAWREQMTERIKDMVKRGFIPEKSIMNEKGEIDPAGAFDKIIGLGKEFLGMVGEFAKNQPATAPPQRVPVAIPTTGPVPAPAPGPAMPPQSTVSQPTQTQNQSPVEIPVTSSGFPERNGMEIIGVKATTPRQ